MELGSIHSLTCGNFIALEDVSRKVSASFCAYGGYSLPPLVFSVLSFNSYSLEDLSLLCLDLWVVRRSAEDIA